jgi:hypothetical protein
MKNKVIFLILPVLLLVLALASCVQTSGTAGRPEVVVISENLTTDEAGGTVLRVTIKNTGRIKADLAEVAVKFYDAGKTLLDSNRDAVMGLDAGATWEFTIPCTSVLAKVASYQVETTAAASSQ